MRFVIRRKNCWNSTWSFSASIIFRLHAVLSAPQTILFVLPELIDWLSIGLVMRVRVLYTKNRVKYWHNWSGANHIFHTSKLTFHEKFNCTLTMCNMQTNLPFESNKQKKLNYLQNRNDTITTRRTSAAHKFWHGLARHFGFHTQNLQTRSRAHTHNSSILFLFFCFQLIYIDCCVCSFRQSPRLMTKNAKR